jgi:hypothetical protein
VGYADGPDRLLVLLSLVLLSRVVVFAGCIVAFAGCVVVFAVLRYDIKRYKAFLRSSGI